MATIMCEGNHLIINDSQHDKIAFLSSINKERRQFVASSKFKNEASFLMEQIICQRKASQKVPFMLKKKCFYTQKSIEQATHYKVAEWKAKHIASQSKSKDIISLTAGLGVDDYFLSFEFNSVTSLDLDLELHTIGVYNNKQMGRSNIKRIHQSCLAYLETNTPSNHTIYIDPDRQAKVDSNNKKVTEFSPNILEIAPKLLTNQNIVFIKLSGVTDLNWIENNVPDISQIHIISLANEVKEILVKLDPIHKKVSPQIVITNLQTKGPSTWTAPEITELKSSLGIEENPKYLFRPFNAIVKSNLLKDNKKAISPNTQYFNTSNELLSSFGQLYLIQERITLSLKQLKKHLKFKGINHASVIARNSSLNSNATKNFLNLKESDSTAIFVFGQGKLNQIYIAQKKN